MSFLSPSAKQLVQYTPPMLMIYLQYLHSTSRHMLLPCQRDDSCSRLSGGSISLWFHNICQITGSGRLVFVFSERWRYIWCIYLGCPQQVHFSSSPRVAGEWVVGAWGRTRCEGQTDSLPSGDLRRTVREEQRPSYFKSRATHIKNPLRCVPSLIRIFPLFSELI